MLKNNDMKPPRHAFSLVTIDLGRSSGKHICHVEMMLNIARPNGSKWTNVNRGEMPSTFAGNLWEIPRWSSVPVCFVPSMAHPHSPYYVQKKSVQHLLGWACQVWWLKSFCKTLELSIERANSSKPPCCCQNASGSCGLKFWRNLVEAHLNPMKLHLWVMKWMSTKLYTSNIITICFLCVF